MSTKEIVIRLREVAVGQEFNLRWLMLQAARRLEIEMERRLSESAESRTGYWCKILPDAGLYCSECGDEFYGQHDPECLTPFCGECGARMLNYETGIPMVKEETR